MDELNGRMIACQILITGLIARASRYSSAILTFTSDCDEIHAVVSQIRIGRRRRDAGPPRRARPSTRCSR